MEFEQIVGNKKNKELLKKIIDSNSVLHSYLFVGNEGIGKKLIAIEFAKMILCEGEKKPCNRCKSCIEFVGSNNPDFFELDYTEKSIKIEQIRTMQQKILEKPIISNRKVYIINDAEKMTTEAQNCLLKILEEPPEYATIILITSKEGKLLGTIKSRCIKLNFEKIADDKIKEYLKNKNIISNVEDDMVKICDGSFLKANKLKENLEIYKKTKELLNCIETKNLISSLKQIRNFEKEQLMEVLEYFNILMYNRGYMEAIKYVEDAKMALSMNNNTDMTMDKLVFNLIEKLSVPIK